MVNELERRTSLVFAVTVVVVVVFVVFVVFVVVVVVVRYVTLHNEGEVLSPAPPHPTANQRSPRSLIG